VAGVFGAASGVLCAAQAHTLSTPTLLQLLTRAHAHHARAPPGDALAIAMPMTALSVVLYLGIVLAGCVVVSIADSFSAAEVATRLRLAGARAIFTQVRHDNGGRRLRACMACVGPSAARCVRAGVGVPGGGE
jgi:acyl-coenzyme A synthetase/AMP-(fatty) acid ligase